MRLKPGQVVRRINAESREVVLRAPRAGDLDGLLHFINSLANENVMILVNKKTTRKEEKKWLSSVLAQIKEGKRIHLVAESGGNIIGAAEIRVHSGKESHVGTFGISVLKGHRDLGVGKLLMSEVLRLARAYRLRQVLLEVFVGNDRAILLYKKFGFRQVGRIPRKVLHRGRYIDTLLMVKGL